MIPIELTLWMNATMELIGDGPPSPDQWLMMRDKVANTMGTIVAKKLMETAENVLREQDMKAADVRHLEEMYKLKNRMSQSLYAQNTIPAPTYADIMAKMGYGSHTPLGKPYPLSLGRIA